MITNSVSGTQIDEIAAGIYRISTPADVIPGGFTFNSFLIDDEEPVLFHMGYRRLAAVTLEAGGKVMPVGRLRWAGGSHFEGGEYGAMNQVLAAAPARSPSSSAAAPPPSSFRIRRPPTTTRRPTPHGSPPRGPASSCRRPALMNSMARCFRRWPTPAGSPRGARRCNGWTARIRSTPCSPTSTEFPGPDRKSTRLNSSH